MTISPYIKIDLELSAEERETLHGAMSVVSDLHVLMEIHDLYMALDNLTDLYEIV